MLRLRSASCYALLVSVGLAGCDNSPSPQLSSVDPIVIPPADTTTRTNVNIANPTLTVPTSFPVGDGDELTLVWSDEFDGTQLDPEVWLFETGDGSQYGIPGWGNNERQYYLPDNARLEGGRLIIEARRESVGNFGFTSARISTKDRVAFKYGRIEASMKLPAGQGLWPAFWMLPQDDEPGSPPAEGIYGGFSASGEIDIMESVNIGGLPGPGGLGGGNEIFGTIHFGGEFPANQSTTVEYEVPESLSDGFNTFAVEWDEFEIRWYANGVLYSTQNSWFSAAADFPAPFDQPFTILFNLAVGGDFPGGPDASTPFPATMEVDWVRVYSGEAPTGGMPSEPTEPAMAPTEDPAGVISVFSDAYTDITADYNPSVGQATVYSPAAIAGDQLLKYANLDFQVIDFTANPQDVADKGYLHVDVWTADSTELDLFVVSAGPVEASAPIAVAADSWVSVDIPLTSFAGVDLSNVIQLKFEGNGTIFVDNIYFAGDAPDPAMMTPAPDDVIYATDPNETVDLVTTITAFGTTSQFDAAYALDYSFDPVFQAQSGSGYGLDHIVQLGFIGLPAGFASGYESFGFKIKSSDLPGNAIEVKLEQGGTCGVINLGDTNFSTPLGDDWFEVVVPISDCAGVATAVGVLFERVGEQTANGGTAFSFLVTDIGFNIATALPGTIPNDVIYASDPGEAVDLNATITAFGTTSQFDANYTLDPSFSPVFQAISGSGYGLDHIVQLGFIGLPAGFASGYESFSFKIKSSDLPGNAIEVKLEQGGTCGVINLGDTNFSTPLGDDWFEVVVPISDCAGVATAVGVLFERVGEQTANGGTAFSFLVTDIGFNTAPALPGIVPDDVIYATDPGETVDLTTTITAFGTTSQFEGNYTLDADFNPSFEAQSGSGYGLDHILQLGFIGLPAGFTSAYDEVLFKIKSSDLPNNSIEVKFEQGGTCGLIDLADTNVSTPLGNGWFQVVVPLSGCGDNSGAVGVIFEQQDAQTANGGSAFSVLLTDIGFNTAGALAGLIPDDVIYATDPGETVDLTTTITAFGTTSQFEGNYTLDADFNPSFEAQSGSGYGLDHILQLGFIGLPAGFTSAYDEVLFKIKSSDLPNNSIEVKFEQGGTCGLIDLADTNVSTPLGNGWFQVVVPLSGCGDNSGAVGVIFEQQDAQTANGGSAFSVLLTDIGFNNPAVVSANIVPNGDFENGTFVDPPWKVDVPGGAGIVEVSSAQANGGTFSARLYASVPSGGGPASFPSLKAERLEDGNLTGGESVTVSFDAIAVTSLPGAVPFFVELFSELSGGGATNEILFQPPTFLTNSWQTYSFTTTLGADASGGVSILFKADCGASAGCELDAYIDNVSIVIN